MPAMCSVRTAAAVQVVLSTLDGRKPANPVSPFYCCLGSSLFLGAGSSAAVFSSLSG